jgi:hypothetical protein
LEDKKQKIDELIVKLEIIKTDILPLIELVDWLRKITCFSNHFCSKACEFNSIHRCILFNKDLRITGEMDNLRCDKCLELLGK